MSKKFSILITTKNRKDDLAYTLSKIKFLLDRTDVECIICDDGSVDGTYEMLYEKFPQIELLRNAESKGLIYSRNLLLNITKSRFAISLDDDAHFLSENPLEIIEDYFTKNEKCGLVSFRMFWSTKEPSVQNTLEQPVRVKGFVGGGHAWDMNVWRAIPDYPYWFVFYGEEDFAAYQLFKAGWEIHYLPAVLINHRVDNKARKKGPDYQIRLRRSIRAGWYLYLMFFPISLIPRRILYTLWVQLKLKVFKGDWKAGIALLQAMGDVIINIPRIVTHSNRLSAKEFKEFGKLEETKLYWKPEDEIKLKSS